MHSTLILAGVLCHFVFAQTALLELPLPAQSSIESLIGAKDVGPFRQLSPPKDEQEDGSSNDQGRSRRNRSLTSPSSDQDTSATTTPDALPDAPADPPAANSATPSSSPATSFQAGDFECIDSTKFKLFTSSTGSFVVNSCPPGFCFTRSPPKKNPCIGKDRALAIDARAAA